MPVSRAQTPSAKPKSVSFKRTPNKPTTTRLNNGALCSQRKGQRKSPLLRPSATQNTDKRVVVAPSRPKERTADIPFATQNTPTNQALHSTARGKERKGVTLAIAKELVVNPKQDTITKLQASKTTQHENEKSMAILKGPSQKNNREGLLPSFFPATPISSPLNSSPEGHLDKKKAVEQVRSSVWSFFDKRESECHNFSRRFFEASRKSQRHNLVSHLRMI